MISKLSFETGLFYVFAVLLDVVEAEGEDLNDDLYENFFPIGRFFFVFHGIKRFEGKYLLSCLAL